VLAKHRYALRQKRRIRNPPTLSYALARCFVTTLSRKMPDILFIKKDMAQNLHRSTRKCGNGNTRQHSKYYETFVSFV
jgi:hypothetical protein